MLSHSLEMAIFQMKLKKQILEQQKLKRDLEQRLQKEINQTNQQQQRQKHQQ